MNFNVLFFILSCAIIGKSLAQLADHPRMFKSTGNETVSVDLKSYENDKLAWPSLFHAETAYCLDYEERNFDSNSYTKGFEFVYHIQDKSKSTEGYIGYQPDINSIIITYRGSEDINNWYVTHNCSLYLKKRCVSAEYVLTFFPLTILQDLGFGCRKSRLSPL